MTDPTTLEEAFTYIEECVLEQQKEHSNVGPDDVAHDVIIGICRMWRSEPKMSVFVPEILRCKLGITPKEAFHF